MSDLFGDVPESSPKDIPSLKIAITYLFSSYFLNYFILTTLFDDLSKEEKKIFFLFSPIFLPIELFLAGSIKLLKLLDYIF